MFEWVLNTPLKLVEYNVKGCVRYIFASLFFKSKGQHLGKNEKCFYFTSKALFVLKKIKFYNFRYSNFMKSPNA